jgi:hypothetical protein
VKLETLFQAAGYLSITRGAEVMEQLVAKKLTTGVAAGVRSRVVVQK